MSYTTCPCCETNSTRTGFLCTKCSAIKHNLMNFNPLKPEDERHGFKMRIIYSKFFRDEKQEVLFTHYFPVSKLFKNKHIDSKGRVIDNEMGPILLYVIDDDLDRRIYFDILDANIIKDNRKIDLGE